MDPDRRPARSPRAAPALASALLALVAALVPAPALSQQQSQPQPPAPRDMTVRFRGRAIDLRPYFEGFPYVRFRAEYDANRLFYFRDFPGRRELWTLPLDGGELDLARGTRLGDVDWNARGLREVDFHAPTRQLVVIADDANEERYNLFTVALDTGEMSRLTTHDYVYGYGIDKQHRFVGYVPRHGARGPYRSCVNLIDLSTRQDREVVCDTPALTFTWSEVNFRPDGGALVVAVLRESDRNHQSLVYVDLLDPASRPRTLLDTSVRRRNVGTVREWVSPTQFVYTSNESGFTNVYVYDLAAQGASGGRAVTTFREDVEDVVPFMVGERYLLGVIVKRPHESELFVVDPADGATLARRVFDATAHFLDYTQNRALVALESRRTKFELVEVTVATPAPDRAELAVARRAGVPADVAARVEQCDVERVRVPTFDTDARTGRARELHAFLQTPRRPLGAPARRLAVIESFYGGENRFDTTAQILCEAGVTVLSPSVRGSAGFGAEFAALNDRDLGGNEVYDLVYAGRFLTRRLGIPERNVGLYGGSHGGYEVMRALTMPPGVNDRTEPFQWGFGLSWFGFSNIVTFHETCNIPDWVLLEAGDPRVERDRLLDRSPVTHAARAVAPMLLLHGENDNRVPVRESRMMAAALRAARKPVAYVEFPGQGHGLKGLANQHRVWTEVFAFLERYVDRRAGAPRDPRASRRSARAKWLAGAAALAALLAAGALAQRRGRGGDD